MALMKKCRHGRENWSDCRCRWYSISAGAAAVSLGPDEREARRLYRALSHPRASSGGEFADVAERWLATIDLRARPKTRANYRLAVEHASARIGHWPVERITSADIAECEARIAARHGFAASTMRNIRQAILGVLRFAHEARLVEQVPDMRRHRILEPAKPPRSLSPGEMRAVLEVAAADVRECFRFGYLTGLRPGELLAVERGDVDGAVLHVTRQIVQASGKPGPLKTPHSRRDVDLSREAIASLPAHGGRAWPFLYHTLLLRWHAALKAAGMERCGPHALRHSNASLRIAAGQDIVYVADQLGHANPNITLRVYAHLIRRPGHAADLLDEAAASL